MENVTYARVKNGLILITLTVVLGGCASMVIPKKQKVHLYTTDPELTVLVDGDSIGHGLHSKKRIEKDGVRQIILRHPDRKPDHHVLIPHHRPPIFWIMQPLNIFSVLIGFGVDFNLDKNISYKRHTNLNYSQPQILQRDSLTQNSIEMQRIYLGKGNGPGNFLGVHLKHHKNPEILRKRMEKAKAEAIRIEADRYNRQPNMVVSTPFNVPQFEEKAREDIHGFLAQYGWYQPRTSLLGRVKNLTRLTCRFDNGFMYRFDLKARNSYEQIELSCTWFIENEYGQYLDSFKTTAFSGEFVFGKYSLLYDALLENYLQLIEIPAFSAYLRPATTSTSRMEALELKDTLKQVSKPEEAPKACVTIRTPNGHGSGFAISNDGYLVTNYHVIASLHYGNYEGIVAYDHLGNKAQARVVRLDEENDLAILKVEHRFEYCFRVSDDSVVVPLSTVFTIGTPISTELSQTVSTGIVSGTRMEGVEQLVQLTMSVSPGNSGGPVFDEQGKVLGVLVSRLNHSELEEFCFAVPVNKLYALMTR